MGAATARGMSKQVAPPVVVAAAEVRRRAFCLPLAPEGPNPRPSDLAFLRAQMTMAAVTARRKSKLATPTEAVAANVTGCVPPSPPVHAPHRESAPPHVPPGPHRSAAILFPACTRPLPASNNRKKLMVLRGY